MKVLKFREELSNLILSGEKATTWRLFDDKDLQKGDVVSFVVWESGKEFAHAKILAVNETTFGTLNKSDFEGHEHFSSPQEMYARFSLYYHRSVDASTKVKVLRFLLLN